MVKTVTLVADTPQKVTFEGAYPYYWIDNKTASDVYASVGVPEADKDDTYTITAGSQLRISGGVGNDGITLLGDGKVQIIASTIAACPFKSAPAVGGGGGSNSVSVDEFLNIASTNPVQNKAIKAELDKKANSKHSHNVADISDFPDIPDETAISRMGFTKNSGNYSKPDGGIPKTDLAANVQASLNKADTALQQHQSLAEYVKADDARLTDARPANGGNAATVNGHTVGADVPANAKFTDTTYSKATSSADGLMSAADKKKLDDIVNSGGGISTINEIPPVNGNIALTQSLIPSDGTAYQMPYYIQSGTVTTTGTMHTTGLAVSFKKAYKTPPLLFITAKELTINSNHLNVIANYRDLTATGFVAMARFFNSSGSLTALNSTNYVTQINWLAIGQSEV